ncbi:MAG: hypothetical protein J6A01_08250 [Proteobacteria bacterium]|nr:hypothetical protein [Pseudomonadota bacterium]
MQFRMIPPNTKIKFMAVRKPVMGALFLIALCGLILPFIVSPNWGTSFQGGTSITLHFDEAVPTEQVRKEFVDDPRFESVSVQQIGDESKNQYVVRTRTSTTLNCEKLEVVKQKLNEAVAAQTQQIMTIGQWPVCDASKEDGIRGDFYVSLVPVEGKNAVETLPAATAIQDVLKTAELEAVVSFDEGANRYLVKPTGIQNEVIDLLTTKFPTQFNKDLGLDQIDTVGADVGEKFRSDAIVSILVALLLMLLYIGLRFDARYAPAAVVSLTVTTLITFLFVNIAQIEITLETVAAFLSLVGYGINDTIVTFDRVRENVALAEPGVQTSDIVNKAINECLSRTIITSITTLVAIIPLAVHATGATQAFAIIMSFGICVATFNSMFVSCPMLLVFDDFFKNMAKRNEARKEIAEINAM